MEKEFENREAVLEWMDENQLGRRNLTNDQRSILRGRVYNRTKKAATDNLKRGTVSPKYQSGTSADTAETLATKHGVGRMTIIRDGRKAEDFEKLLKSNPAAAAAVMGGTKRLNEVKREAAERGRSKRRSGNCCLRKQGGRGKKLNGQPVEFNPSTIAAYRKIFANKSKIEAYAEYVDAGYDSFDKYMNERMPCGIDRRYADRLILAMQTRTLLPDFSDRGGPSETEPQLWTEFTVRPLTHKAFEDHDRRRIGKKIGTHGRWMRCPDWTAAAESVDTGSAG